MKMTTRLYTAENIRSTTTRIALNQPWSLATKVLIGLLIVSAFALVYLKDLNRRLFIQYQTMAHTNQQAQIEWGKLLLEESTWTAQASVQQIASNRLKMVIPTGKDIILLRNEK